MTSRLEALCMEKGLKRTGQRRVNPVAYLGDRGRYVLIASKGGAPTHPAWYHNLKASPQAKIEVGAETIDVVASVIVLTPVETG